MSGNVWEWTRSSIASYPYQPDDGREDLEAGDNVLRVVRGGSFLSFERNVRAAIRGRGNPFNRGDDLGFSGGAVPIRVNTKATKKEHEGHDGQTRRGRKKQTRKARKTKREARREQNTTSTQRANTKGTKTKTKARNENTNGTE